MNIPISHQNPMINFRKQALNHQESQKQRGPKISPKCMKKKKKKPKRRDIIVIPALREENLAKIEKENNKKCDVLPCQVGERRKVENLFEKDDLKQSKNCFKKT